MTDTPIDDPLARFYDEEKSRTAGVKHPVTGMREPYDKAKRDQIRTDEIKRKVQVKKRILSWLLADDLGREWLYDLLVSCNVEGTPFASTDRLTAYNAGALHVGMLLKADIKNAGIREYFLMLQEGWEREKLWDDTLADKSAS